jgi:serine O-acetyltransferase
MLFTVQNLVKLYKYPFIKEIARRLVLLLGADIPTTVTIGHHVAFPHNALGTVIHAKTIICDNAKVFQNVTIGRGDAYNVSENDSLFEGVIIGESAIICTGAKILGKEGKLIIGKNSIVGANAVLLSSTNDNEIWVGGGGCAKLLRQRDDLIDLVKGFDCQ